MPWESKKKKKKKKKGRKKELSSGTCYLQDLVF